MVDCSMDEAVDKRKYRVLEIYLNKLTKTDISLDEQEQKRYNDYLKRVLKSVVEAMKENDQLFDCTFKQFLYAGSSYENLKVGKPNEFDINLQFKLPSSDFEITDNHEPGYVEVLVKSLDEKETRRCFQNFPDGETKLRKAWLDDRGFLHRSKVSDWMQAVVDKALKALGTQPNLEMLNRLKCNLKEGKIPFFWNERVNLLVGRNESELQGMSNRLTRILKKIDDRLEECPGFILTFFGRSEDEVQNLDSSPSSPGSSQERASPPRTSQQEMPRIGNLQTRSSPSRSLAQDMSSLKTPTELSEGSDSCGESDKKNQPRSKGSTTPSAPTEDDERIDWRTVETVIKIGAYAGAVFAAGAYLMLRNAQRQAREQANNNSSSDNNSNTHSSD